jgi:catechol 2,3-dioxygenase-like lactoylglutathione lyase family enzyme
MEVNGVAHIMLSVNNFEACVTFYEKVLGFMGLKPVIKNDRTLYCVGGRTAVGIGRADEKYRHDRFDRRRTGLAHIAFRARERADVDSMYQYLMQMDANIEHSPAEGPFAPGFYSVVFLDPDGIVLEVAHVPGKGLLE